jgi:hypothetical protein
MNKYSIKINKKFGFKQVYPTPSVIKINKFYQKIFYSKSYKNFNIIERDFAYAQRFGKGKDHSGAKVKHLYITNYDVND